MTRIVAVVPVRSLLEGKSRLADVLSPRRRAALIESMLARVLASLCAAKTVDRIVVVSPDETLPLPVGVERLCDRGVGLNEAIVFARQRLADTAGAMLVVAADAPQVTAAEIDRLVERARDVEIAIVPDRHERGTNSLWMRLPTRFEPQFGVHSALAHVAEARRLGLSHLVLPVPGLSHDVDVERGLDGEPMPDDVARLLAEESDMPTLLRRAEKLTAAGFGSRVGYSRKVFIPLTRWCRDVCHYCTFAAPPRKGSRAFLTMDEVLEIARAR